MNLTTDKLQELNRLLSCSSLNLPQFRRKVDSTGNNYKWLKKNLTKRNPNPPSELLSLLSIKNKSHGKQKAEKQAG